MRILTHFLVLALVLIGFYAISVNPPIMRMELFAFGNLYVLEAMQMYTLLIVVVSVMYLAIRIALLAGHLFSWASRFQQSKKNSAADRLIRQAIECWVIGNPDRAARKFEKASVMLPHDPLRELFSAWLLASKDQLQLADAKVLDLLNKKLINEESAAGIRARLYLENSQAPVAAAILSQQVMTRPSRGLLELYCQILYDHQQRLLDNYIKSVVAILPCWRLVKDKIIYKKVIKQACLHAIKVEDSDFFVLWPYAKSILSKEEILYIEYFKIKTLDKDAEAAVDLLLSHLHSKNYLSLYQLLGDSAYRVDDQIKIANRWMVYVAKDISSEVLTRLYFKGGDIQQGVEFAREYLAITDKTN